MIPIRKLERREPPASEVAHRLLDYLLTSDIQPGARLPSERQLATSLDIGRSAVRDALRPLTWLGIIEVRQGDGTYLRGLNSDLLPKIIEWGLLLGEKRVLDLVEARRYIETVTARFAAERRTDAGLDELRSALARMAECKGDLAGFVDADIAFHLKVADIAGNSILSGILSSIQSLLRVWIERLSQSMASQEEAYLIHVPIFEAIEAGECDMAAAAMANHLESATERLLRTLGTDPNGSDPHTGEGG